MVSIRTALITMSPMLGDIITRAVAGNVVLDVVARLDGENATADRLRMLTPELILIGLSAHESDAVALAALAVAPTAKVIAFTADCRHAHLLEMRPHRALLIDVTPAALVDAILGRSTGKSV